MAINLAASVALLSSSVPVVRVGVARANPHAVRDLPDNRLAGLVGLEGRA